MSDPLPADHELVEFSVEILQEAGDLTLEFFHAAEFEIERKGDGSPVTEADKAAERLLRERIEARFPDDAILGEEEPPKEGSSGRRWVIDPIDGTESFTHGVALYSNLLYLEDAAGPLVGVINIPAIAELVAAGRGIGCWFNGVPCRVNDHGELRGSLMSASGFDWWEPEMLQRVRDSGMAMRTWGDGYGYLLVATGRIEAMIDPAANFWDIAPCQVIVSEAGGRWSAIDGAPDAHRGSFVATNGHLHDAVLEILGATT